MYVAQRSKAVFFVRFNALQRFTCTSEIKYNVIIGCLFVFCVAHTTFYGIVFRSNEETSPVETNKTKRFTSFELFTIITLLCDDFK